MLPTELLLLPFQLPVWGTSLLFAVTGALLTFGLSRQALFDCGEADRGWSAGAALAGFACCGAFAWCALMWKVQETPVVRPTELWAYWRIGHHVVLIALMLAVTVTDLRAYLIPDRIPLYGVVWGVLLAGLSGDLQMEHFWVDWNQEIPQLRGPYVPDWIAAHPHWHGVAWSLAGAACGAIGTWLIRAMASLALGQEAMGLGDVTLMAMIGAFLGWQATLVVLLLAPVCGLVVTGLLLLGHLLWSIAASLVPALRGAGHFKTYLPYGPFLCLAAYIVLLTWRWIWMFELQLAQTASASDRINTFAVRRLFGDWVSLLLIGGVTLAALVIVLFLRRVYRNLPVMRRTATEPELADSGLEESHPADSPMDTAPLSETPTNELPGIETSGQTDAPCGEDA